MPKPLSSPRAVAPTTDGPLTVLYDGACPLCRREIAHMQGLALAQAKTADPHSLHFLDVSAEAATQGCGLPLADAERQALLARFHVQRADGSRLSGAAAFVALWQRLPGWRWLARAARLPGALPVLEAAYRGFLHLRPGLQALARRWDKGQHRPGAAPGMPTTTTATTATIAATLTTNNTTAPIAAPAEVPAEARIQAPSTATTSPVPRLSRHLLRELRSDHAGETGAVAIYRGMAAVAARRGQAGLLAMARRHAATEAEHLRLLCERLPPAQRSRLLGPWRLAGWLTGALPALAGPRAVHATIAAVETFVDQHYQQQIDHLQRHGDPGALLPLLQRCQADERAHQQEAQAALLQGQVPLPLALRAWCACVGAGSAVAVALARRI